MLLFNGLADCLAQDSSTSETTIIKITTPKSYPYFKITAEISLKKYPKDTFRHVSIIFKKDKYTTDTFVIKYESDTNIFHVKFEPISCQDILPDDTLNNTIVDYYLYELDTKDKIPSEKEYLVRIKLYYDPKNIDFTPSLYFIMRLPTVKHVNIKKLPVKENYQWEKYYTPNELIYRITPGVPR